MRKFKIRPTLLGVILTTVVFVSCQEQETVQPILLDQPGTSYGAINCSSSGNNNTDYSNPANVGTLDDRTCSAEYREESISGVTYGVYKVKTGSLNAGPSHLQPRMERSLTPVNNVKGGNYSQLSGTFRVAKVPTSGTYIMQVKGKHTGGGGSPDPAICLYRAEKTGTTTYKIVREQITYRGGSSGSGRTTVTLFSNLSFNTPYTFTLKTGFWGNPVNQHYANFTLDGTTKYWNIPEPERATQAKLRYGCYRVKDNESVIKFANTTYTRRDL